MLNPEFLAVVFISAGVYALLAQSVQLQFGYGGLLNFGAVAPMIVAAYTMVIAIIHFHAPMWLGAVAGLAAAAALGALTALPAFSLRSIYFGFASIAVAEILRALAMNLTPITGGPIGTVGMLGSSTAAMYNPEWYAFEDSIRAMLKPLIGSLATRNLAMALIVWVTVLVSVSLLEALVRSPWGRALRSIREDEDVAAATGKDVNGIKLAAFVIGAVVAGMGGLMFAWHISAFAPSDFAPIISFYAFVIVLLSGTGRMWATPIGALLFSFVFTGTRFFEFWPFTLVDSIDRQYVRILMIGVILIGIMLFRPQGLFGRRQESLL